MKRFLREPLVHFLLAGTMLFGLYSITQSGRPLAASSKEISHSEAGCEPPRTGKGKW